MKCRPLVWGGVHKTGISETSMHVQYGGQPCDEHLEISLSRGEDVLLSLTILILRIMVAQIPSPDGMAFPEMQHANATYPVQSYNASTAHYDYRPPSSQSEIRQDRMKQNPLESLELDELDIHVKALFEKEFKDKKSVTEEELIIGARLARSSELFAFCTRSYSWRFAESSPQIMRIMNAIQAATPIKSGLQSLHLQLIP